MQRAAWCYCNGVSCVWLAKISPAIKDDWLMGGNVKTRRNQEVPGESGYDIPLLQLLLHRLEKTPVSQTNEKYKWQDAAEINETKSTICLISRFTNWEWKTRCLKKKFFFVRLWTFSCPDLNMSFCLQSSLEAHMNTSYRSSQAATMNNSSNP